MASSKPGEQSTLTTVSQIIMFMRGLPHANVTGKLSTVIANSCEGVTFRVGHHHTSDTQGVSSVGPCLAEAELLPTVLVTRILTQTLVIDQAVKSTVVMIAAVKVQHMAMLRLPRPAVLLELVPSQANVLFGAQAHRP